MTALTVVDVLHWGAVITVWWVMFWLCAYLFEWYDVEVTKESANYDRFNIVFRYADDGSPKVQLYSWYNSVVMHTVAPVYFLVIAGALYETSFVKQRRSWLLSVGSTGTPQGATNLKKSESHPSRIAAVLAAVRRLITIKVKIASDTWASFGELTVFAAWVVSHVTGTWAATKWAEDLPDYIEPCPFDVTKTCWNYIDSGADAPELAPNMAQYKLYMAALGIGFLATTDLALVLLPVSRTSRLWAALDVPFERAVLYHKIIGHTFFWDVVLHAFLCCVYWIWFQGWDYMWSESVTWDGSSDSYRHSRSVLERQAPDVVTEPLDGVKHISIPAGWMALLFGVPLWITSTGYVRRHWYSLFKAVHWMCVPVLYFSVMHYYGVAAFLIAPVGLYAAHIATRLASWQRWRLWQRWTGPAAERSSSAPVAEGASKTRKSPVHGGSFVYMSVPGAMAQGANEAHAITVALRGAPPAVPGCGAADRCSFYIKDSGAWSGAVVRMAGQMGLDPQALIVDTDGPYIRCATMLTLSCGAAASGTPPRVLLVAGEVHLVWVCRNIQELTFVGAAIPSFTAGSKASFTVDLYCTRLPAANPSSIAHVTWPAADASLCSPTNVASRRLWWPALNDVVLTTIALGGTYCGYLLFWEIDAQNEYGGWFINGLHFIFIALGALLALMAWHLVLICASCVARLWPSHACASSTLACGSDAWGGSSRTNSSSGTSPGQELPANAKLEAGGETCQFPVTAGRPDLAALFCAEKERGVKNGWFNGSELSTSEARVPVLVSGPAKLVHDAFKHARQAGGRNFDVHEYSFEF
ncbi:hypothetical protein JKP88DRAFT_278524 [Tribonema minus]|uniref:Ferric oxidoreductase domain-containing protein n=1 Tax=Tribonema minus TaxID=303371 RepID=A0A835YW60_9STRA|nr:hypothetical protein JKP88DRAFT_278524 [Tribonema minus]